jgi:hypothetical protein
MSKIVKQWKQVGDQSSNAFAMALSKGYMNNKYIVKTPRVTKKPVDSLHYEYFIGRHLNNTLCKSSVNFQRVYGYMKCKKEEYLLIERIHPGISFRQYFSDHMIWSPTIESLILQVLCSLQIAQNCIEFVHYDLHFGNILIRKDKTMPSITYTYTTRRSKKPQVLTVPVIDNTIACFIDYGRSHTSLSKSYFKEFPDEFQRYDFLKRLHKLDIRTFDKVYDLKRFLSLIMKYIKGAPDFNFKVIKEPNDAIQKIKESIIK